METKVKLKGQRKINDVEVASIKESYENGGMSQATLARVYGVSQAQVSRIITGRQRKVRT